MPTTLSLHRRSGLAIESFPIPDSGESVISLKQGFTKSWVRPDTEFVDSPISARKHQLLLPQVTAAGTYLYTIDKRGAVIIGGSNTAALRALNSVETGIPSTTVPTPKTYTAVVSGTAGKARFTVASANYNVGEIVTVTGTYTGSFAVISIDSSITFTLDVAYAAAFNGALVNTLTARALDYSFANLRNFELTLTNTSDYAANSVLGSSLRAGINATLSYGISNTGAYAAVSQVTTNVFPLQVTDPGESASLTMDLPSGSIFYSLAITIPLYSPNSILTFTGLSYRSYA